jgi:hypothetical protein
MVRLKIIHQVFVSFKHNGASPAAKHSPLVITCRNSISNASFPAQTPAAKKTEQGILLRSSEPALISPAAKVSPHH